MRRMKRFTFVIILMLAVPISFYFLVFERPIKASPNELILSSDELPNWEFVQGSSSSDDAINYFHNSSVEVGYNLTIAIRSFSSSGSAHDFFKQSTYPSEPPSPSLADEGGRFISTGYDVWKETYYLTWKACTYEYREANIFGLFQLQYL